jgi:hypothetical protein
MECPTRAASSTSVWITMWVLFCRIFIQLWLDVLDVWFSNFNGMILVVKVSARMNNMLSTCKNLLRWLMRENLCMKRWTSRRSPLMKNYTILVGIGHEFLISLKCTICLVYLVLSILYKGFNKLIFKSNSHARILMNCVMQ